MGSPSARSVIRDIYSCLVDAELICSTAMQGLSNLQRMKRYPATLQPKAELEASLIARLPSRFLKLLLHPNP